MLRFARIALFLVAFAAFSGTAEALMTLHPFESPNKDFKIEICIGPLDQTSANVFYKGNKFLTLDTAGFVLDDGFPAPSVLASREWFEKLRAEEKPRPKRHEGVRIHDPKAVREPGKPPYNEAVVEYEGCMKIIFRAYDDGIAFRYEFAPKNETPLEIKQELTTLKFNNFHAFRENRSEPEAPVKYLVSEVKEGDASLRIEIPNTPKMIAGEIPISRDGFPAAKFQQDAGNPADITLVLDGTFEVAGINAYPPWRFVKIEQDDMLKSLKK